MGSGPPRRPLAGRRKTPRPQGYHALGKAGFKGFLLDALGRFNRALHASSRKPLKPALPRAW